MARAITYVFYSVGSAGFPDVRAIRIIAGLGALLILLALGAVSKVYLPPPADLTGLALAGGVSLVLGIVLVARLASTASNARLTISPEGIEKTGLNPFSLGKADIQRIRNEGRVVDTYHPASSRCRRWRVVVSGGTDWLLDDSLWQATINTMTLTYRPDDHPGSSKTITVGDALIYSGLRTD